MKKNLLSVICFLLPVTCNLSPVTAAIPTDYYKSIDGKTGDAIWSTLFDRIKSHTDVGYDGLWDVYDDADIYPGTTTTWDIYSNCGFETSKKQCGNYSTVCDCQNREHTVPQSWWSGSGMKSDAFHVMPTDGKVNGQRSNYPYGECSGGTSLGGKALGKLGKSTFSGYSDKVFEPDDEYKGDVARNYFYMITCYMNNSFTKSTEGKVMFTTADGHAAFTSYGIALLLKWHRQDPVSQKEIDRNNAVYKHQKNRNPYIDYPCLVEYIWGEHKSEKLDLSALMSSENEKFLDPEYNSGCNCKTDDPTVLYPKQSTTVAVGSASVKESVSKDILVQGANLTQSLSLALSGTNASYFSLAKNTITATEALSGYNLTVTYRPEATTTTTPHSATLTISSSELKSARTITLTGESKAELVTPAVGTECRLNTEGVGTTTTIKIPVKGTNLTKGINVGLISGAPATFSVQPTAFTANQINAGDTITVTYTPTAIGEESTKIYINQSNPAEFDQRFVSIHGACSFTLKEPTDITHESATLNWVKTEKNSYMVDVFFLKQIEEKEHVILCDTAGKHVTAKSGTYSDVTGYIRLGASKSTGYITYTGLDLSKPSTLTVTAKAYNNDSDVKCKITVDTKDTTITLTSSDVSYVINLPAGSQSATVQLASIANSKRVLIKTVQITTGGTKEEREHLTGYPRSENFLSHTVYGLFPETEYSYTITPDGLPESEIATFTTSSQPTGLDSLTLHHSPFTKVMQDGHILILCNGQLYDLLGNPLMP